jgi:hypothetical protein
MTKVPKLPKVKDFNHFIKKRRFRLKDIAKIISQISVFWTTDY